MFKKILDLFDSLELLLIIVFATVVLIAVFCGVFFGILESGNLYALVGVERYLDRPADGEFS